MLVVGLLGFLGYKVFTKIQDKKETASLTETLPEFALTDLAGQMFTNSDLKANKTVLLIFFNTNCEYWQYEARDIQENLSDFKDAHLVFISSQEITETKSFSKSYQLYNYDNVYFLHDQGAALADAVEANSIPYMLVYDKEHNLLNRFKGQTRASNLLELINVKSSL